MIKAPLNPNARKKLNILLVVTCIILSLGIALIELRNRHPNLALVQLYAKLTDRGIAKDFTTPEGAVLCLEDAYRHHDIEAAIAAKDFKTEARLMLEETGFKNVIDDETVSKTAEALTLSFRAYTTNDWPNFDRVESSFIERQPYTDNVVVVTEVCHFPDGGSSNQRLLVSKTDNGWRVLNPKSN